MTMKTRNYLGLILFLLVLTGGANAQLKVGINGKIGVDQALPNDSISLNIHNAQTIDGSIGLRVGKAAALAGSHKARGIVSFITPDANADGQLIGVEGKVIRSQAASHSRAVGVRGIAGNYTDGYNYGVFGRLYGDKYGAGVYGTIYDYPLYDCYVHDKFAGYFDGDVAVYGSLKVNGQEVLTSDRRLKENINPLSEKENILEKILQLNPVRYNLKSPIPMLGITESGDTLSRPRELDSTMVNKDHFGFIAQELKEIYPDLVYTNKLGVLSINYNGMIPILAEGIKTLQKAYNKTKTSDSLTINHLEDRIVKLESEVELLKSSCCDGIADQKSSEEITTDTRKALSKEQIPRIYQNRPNPFSQSTRIEYYLPAQAQSAYIYIYDMEGSQINNYKISTPGKGHIIIEGGFMDPGIYMYSLIVDQKEIGTRKMILTQ